MVFHSLKICLFNLRYFFYVNVHIEIALGIIFIMTQSNKSRPHKITGLPSCWFCFAGIVNRAEAPFSASLVTLALCTKTIYQDYNSIWKCLCIPLMQLVINLTSGSLPTYKLKLQGMVAMVHVETIGLGQIFIEDCKPFCKDREREILYIYIYDICSFLTFTTQAGWQSSYFLNSHLPLPPPHNPFSVTSPHCYQYGANDTRHRHLQRSIMISRWSCQKSTVGLKKKKSVCFLMESIIIEKYVSIEPRAMHWVDHCVCLLEIFKKAKRKEKKNVFVSSP